MLWQWQLGGALTELMISLWPGLHGQHDFREEEQKIGMQNTPFGREKMPTQAFGLTIDFVDCRGSRTVRRRKTALTCNQEMEIITEEQCTIAIFPMWKRWYWSTLITTTTVLYNRKSRQFCQWQGMNVTCAVRAVNSYLADTFPLTLIDEEAVPLNLHCQRDEEVAVPNYLGSRWPCGCHVIMTIMHCRMKCPSERALVSLVSSVFQSCSGNVCRSNSSARTGFHWLDPED